MGLLALYIARLTRRIERVRERNEGIGAFLLEQAQINLLPILIGNIDKIWSLLTSGPVWSLIVTYTTEVYLTALVFSDWMLHLTSDEWNTEETQHLLDLNEQGALGDDVSAEDLLRQRE